MDPCEVFTPGEWEAGVRYTQLQSHVQAAAVLGIEHSDRKGRVDAFPFCL